MTDIKGYRVLSPDEVAAVNRIKTMAEEVGKLVSDLRTAEALPGGVEPDNRWLAIGNTHLQEGFMALVRAVAKPTTF
jgi:hypothetical protein